MLSRVTKHWVKDTMKEYRKLLKKHDELYALTSDRTVRNCVKWSLEYLESDLTSGIATEEEVAPIREKLSGFLK